eukprot:1139485-Pelagomonas_calceolata.AAC.17
MQASAQQRSRNRTSSALEKFSFTSFHMLCSELQGWAGWQKAGYRRGTWWLIGSQHSNMCICTPVLSPWARAATCYKDRGGNKDQKLQNPLWSLSPCLWTPP